MSCWLHFEWGWLPERRRAHPVGQCAGAACAERAAAGLEGAGRAAPCAGHRRQVRALGGTRMEGQLQALNRRCVHNVQDSAEADTFPHLCRFFFLTRRHALRLPTPPQMHNKGNFVCSLRCTPALHAPLLRLHGSDIVGMSEAWHLLPAV
jgi:hypothetical protein